MLLPFLDRSDELRRLRRLLEAEAGTLAAVYGRRRCGKSRLIQEATSVGRSVYYVGDDRDSTLQRASMAREIAGVLPGFDAVTYPDWEALLMRWWADAASGSVLAVDELPTLVAAAPELPSLLQKLIDRHRNRQLHLILAGSSQRMMHGLVLDRAAPLFGRADEILRIDPLPAGWIRDALAIADPVEAVEAYAVWGGVPRYWELVGRGQGPPSQATAIQQLILDPLGVLHEEPAGLLLDDLRDTTQAASILSLIGRGCHRPSEIAARLGRPATSLSRPLQRLIDLRLIRRDLPFGATARSGKRSLYKIDDPFLAFWFRFVEPNRSRLAARKLDAVWRLIQAELPRHISETWEELARASVPRLRLQGRTWGPASRWWGPGIDRQPLELDLVAASDDGTSLLVGEAKWTQSADPAELLRALRSKVERLPFVDGRRVVPGLWLKTGRGDADPAIVTADQVLDALV